MTDAPLTRDTLEDAAAYIRRWAAPTAQISWPLLSARAACEVWVKHENHNPTGAFKVRGGLTYLRRLLEAEPAVAGVAAATRGNHGQSIAHAAAASGIEARIYVPHGNSREKNAAMRAYGATLVEHGGDFQEALEFAQEEAAARKLHMIPSYHPWLVEGVATYAAELFAGAPELDTVYVPIGLGSGICSVMAVRHALGLATEVVGVVAENAPAYSLSVAAGAPVSTNSADTLADGLAVRVPNADALAAIMAGAARVVTVSEDEIRTAMRAYYTDTHNLAEGAGAAALAALLKEKSAMAGKRVGLILSGGNIDMATYRAILAEAPNAAAGTAA